LPFGLTEINSDKPVFTPDYCRNGAQGNNLTLAQWAKGGANQFFFSDYCRNGAQGNNLTLAHWTKGREKRF